MPSVFDNPNYLPLDIAVAIEQHASNATPEKPEPDTPASVADLVDRLTKIRERLFWLAACFATSLSWDAAREADRYRELFRDLADELRKQDASALDRIVQGHEALLLAEPMPKPTIPLAVQEWAELIAEVRTQRSKPPAPKPSNYVSDGLQQFL